MKFILKSLILCLSALSLQGQSYHNALSIGYMFASPPIGSEQSKIDKLYVLLSLPLKLKNGDYFIINPEFHKQAFQFEEGKKISCLKTGLSLNYLKLNAKRNTIGILNISNNFETGHFEGHSIQVGGGLLFSKKQSPSLRWKYGLYMNKEYFGLLIVPLFGLDYKINAKHRVFGILPQNMRYEYKMNAKLRSGILFETPLYTYQLQQSTSKYIDQRQITLGVYQSIYLSKNLVLEIAIKTMSGKVKLFQKEQTYAVNILGEGIGGRRAAEQNPEAHYKTNLAIDFSLNYRIEVE